MYYAYILQCADDTLYVGCTNNLEKRLKQHNEDKCGAHYTKIRSPVMLKHAEEFDNIAEARAREAEIKRCNRTEKLAIINSKKEL